MIMKYIPYDSFWKNIFQLILSISLSLNIILNELDQIQYLVRTNMLLFLPQFELDSKAELLLMKNDLGLSRERDKEKITGGRIARSNFLLLLLMKIQEKYFEFDLIFEKMIHIQRAKIMTENCLFIH